VVEHWPKKTTSCSSLDARVGAYPHENPSIAESIHGLTFNGKYEQQPTDVELSHVLRVA